MILKNLNIVGEANGTKDIKVEEGIITNIRDSGHPDYSNDKMEINFNDSIIFPGLINSHDHLEFNLYPQLGHNVYQDYVEWGSDIHFRDKEIIRSIESIPSGLRIRYGIIKNLLCGVTSVAHHGAASGIPDDSPISIIKDLTSVHSVRIGGKWKLKLNWIKNLEPYVIHIGEGLNLESHEEINELIRWNLFKRRMIGIHGITMTGKQSENFDALVWCPVSNLFLFNKTADILNLKRNTKILFGTDSTLTAGWNIWEHIRKARELGLMNDEELFSSVSNKAAEIWDLEGYGIISKYKRADLVISKKKHANSLESFFRNDPEDILLILKNGKLILYDESIKEQILLQMKQLRDFVEVNLNGKMKFVKYPVMSIISELNEYGHSLSIPVIQQI